VCQEAERSNSVFGTTVNGNNIPDANTVTNACGSAGTGQLLQLVFYPLAALAAGAGVSMIMTSGSSSKEKEKTGLMILPQVDHTGGKLDLLYRF
jgi:hypothetical protein